MTVDDVASAGPLGPADAALFPAARLGDPEAGDAEPPRAGAPSRPAEVASPPAEAARPPRTGAKPGARPKPAPAKRGGKAKGAREPAAELPVARVCVDLPLPHLDRPFDYLV